MQKKSLKFQAYEIIKEKIIDCTYKPNDFLSESILMNEIGVGRTPIREALNRLEQEKLINIIPKKGILVCGLTIHQIKEIYEVRTLVEPYIIRTYGSTIEKEKIKQLMDNLEEAKSLSPRLEMFEVDDELHKVLIESSNNSYLMHLTEKTSDQNQRIRILTGRLNLKRMIESYDEHFSILEHMYNGNYEESAKAMERHIENSKRTALDYIY